MKQQRWILRSLADESVVERLRTELNSLSRALARALYLRGISTLAEARNFFRSGLEDLADPMGLKDMNVAANRLSDAIEADEEIVVYGDYDVDGTTSTALLTGVLQSLGARVRYFVPNRLIHGYGLSVKGIDDALSGDTRLICALDCGITSIDEAAYIKSVGVDLIICDHHTPKSSVPEAIAIVDPKRVDCTYAFKDFCGCGLTYRLCEALFQVRDLDPTDLEKQLDLVALATVSDVVSATGENRILLRAGLERLRTSPRVGLRLLAQEAGIKLSDCNTSSILFSLGPRINAAGRLGDAERAVAMLLSHSEVEAAARARQLERLNNERRTLDAKARDEAFEIAERMLLGKDRSALVVYKADWHSGIVGIVASRLVDRFYRPAVVMSSVGGRIRGSARSANGVNVLAAINSCSDLLVEFGGHDFAAGLTIEEENIAAFTERFDEAVAQMVSASAIERTIEVDAELPLSHITERFWAVLNQFEPFGPENDAPIFMSRNLQVDGTPRTVGKDRSHLKFRVRDRGTAGLTRDVIGFRMGAYVDIVTESRATGEPLDLLYSVQENTWNGRKSLQLLAKDIRFTTES